MKCPTTTRLSPLHTHSTYSVLDAASTIDEYVKFCVETGAPALGLTDHGLAIGALELYDKAKKKGITPLPGCEFYVAPDRDYQFAGKPYDYFHLTVWAINEIGYRNLLKLASLAWKDDKLMGYRKNPKTGAYSLEPIPRVVKKFGDFKPRITFEEILTYNEGLVLGTGCLIGAISKALLQGEALEGERNLQKLLEVYQGRMFTEIMPEACTHDYDRKTKRFVRNECTAFAPDGDIQKACNLKLVEISRRYGLPLLMTTDAHFVKPEQKHLQDILLQSGDPDGWRFYNSYHAKTTEMAWEAWEKNHGTTKESVDVFVEAVENNDVLHFLAKDIKISDPYHQPTPSIPEEIRSLGLSPAAERKALLLQLVDKHGRMKWGDPVWEERLNREISVVCDNGEIDFSDYFLFLEELCSTARARSILVGAGRGSGAGSLLCYLLKITHLDPIRYQLPFERFLSNSRIKRRKLPDIDLDFGDRDVLLAYLREKFGDKMAQCSTHQTARIKSAIKSLCRVKYGKLATDPEVDGVTKTIDDTPTGVADRDFLLGYTDKDGNVHQGHLELNPVLQKFFDDYPGLQEDVVMLLGIPEALSRHASAFLISDVPIWETVPTCNIGGYTCTQYTASAANNYVEKAGLIKFDILRVNTLSMVSGAIRLAQRTMGYQVWEEKHTYDGEEFTLTMGELDITQVPMTPKGHPEPLILDIYDLPDMEDVFDDICNGDTRSLFQISTPLMTSYAKRQRPRRVFHLSDLVAMIRPGALESLIEDGVTTTAEAYIKRKNGEMAITYAHPDMEPILKDTFGAALYQEQLQAIFSDLAGYSSEEADALREMLAKKKKQEIEKFIPELRKRLTEKHWTETQIEMLVSLSLSSAQYSFNRSHSAAYAVVAYMCAFLKHYFRIEWWTAVLSNCKVEEIREKGYDEDIRGFLKFPHVNGPMTAYDYADGFVHAPLYLIDKVGDAACHIIKTQREQGGRYTSLQDFFERACREGVNQGVVLRLILCGAFSEIEPDKSWKQLMEEYFWLKKVAGTKKGKDLRGQALTEATAAYRAKRELKGVYADFDELSKDQVEIEIMRAKMLPIYQMDVHTQFKELMKQKIGIEGRPSGILSYRTKDNHFVEVLRDNQHFSRFHRDRNKYDAASFVGIIRKTEEFNFDERSSGRQATALKIQLMNNGDTIEAIMWPDLYDAMKAAGQKLNPDRFLMTTGTIKPGKGGRGWSMSVSRFLPI